MAIAFDAADFSATTSSNTSITWTHTPVGTPRGIIVFIGQNTNDGTDRVTSVTYGSETMTEMSGSPLLHTTSQPGAVYGYFLGTNIPTGAQTVTVNLTGSGSIIKSGGSVSLTANEDTSTVDIDATMNSDSQADPSVTLQLGGVTCFAMIGALSGRASVIGVTPLTSWTERNEQDYGEQIGIWYTFDTIGSADVTAGWTQGADDATMIAVAIREDVAGGFTPRSYPRGANRGLLRGVA